MTNTDHEKYLTADQVHQIMLDHCEEDFQAFPIPSFLQQQRARINKGDLDHI